MSFVRIEISLTKGKFRSTINCCLNLEVDESDCQLNIRENSWHWKPPIFHNYLNCFFWVLEVVWLVLLFPEWRGREELLYLVKIISSLIFYDILSLPWKSPGSLHGFEDRETPGSCNKLWQCNENCKQPFSKLKQLLGPCCREGIYFRK